jgi:membrane protease YdiL (CAAX protease family)
VSESIPEASLPPSLPGPLAETALVARWRWWVHLLLIGSYPLIIVAIGSLRGPDHEPALSQSVRGLLLVCAVELVLFSLVFGLGWLFSRASRDELLLRWRPGVWVVPLGLGYSLGIRMAVGFLVAVISAVVIATGAATPESLKQFFTDNRPQIETRVDVPMLRDNPAYYWLSLTLVSFVVAGLREELWRSAVLSAMRKLWPRAFDSFVGQLIAVALVAAVFGAAHANQGIIGATMAGLLGLLLGVIMVWHRSIWPAVIAHGLFDATSIALIPFAMEKLKQIAH